MAFLGLLQEPGPHQARNPAQRGSTRTFIAGKINMEEKKACLHPHAPSVLRRTFSYFNVSEIEPHLAKVFA